MPNPETVLTLNNTEMLADDDSQKDTNFDPNSLLRKAYPSISDDIKNERDKEDKKVLFTELAYSHPTGKAIFKALNRTSISFLQDSDLPPESQEKYQQHFLQGELDYMNSCSYIESTTLDIRKQETQRQLDALSHVKPLTTADVIADFRTLQLDRKTS